MLINCGKNFKGCLPLIESLNVLIVLCMFNLISMVNTELR